MARPGASPPRRQLNRVDQLLSSPDFREVHERRVAAPPREAITAVAAATPGEMPLVRLLFLVRSGPALLARGRGLPRAKTRPLLAQLIEFGFVPLVEEDDEVVLGYVGQPWKPAGGSMPRLPSADDWRAFEEPGYLKAVMSFRARPEGDATVLSTETRLRATDAASRRRFTPYWYAIRAASGAIRRSWLRAAARRAAH